MKFAPRHAEAPKDIHGKVRRLPFCRANPIGPNSSKCELKQQPEKRRRSKMASRLTNLGRLGIVLAATTLSISVARVSYAQCFLMDPNRNKIEAGDRPGGDYNDFLQPDPCNGGGGWLCGFDPRRFACQDACDSDDRCLVWVFARPEVTGGPSHCWLKDTVTDAVPNATNRTTGLKYEYDTNRNASDYAHTTTNTAAECANTCMQDGPCRAWTWVQASHDCWLKSSIPAPSYYQGAISGSYVNICID